MVEPVNDNILNLVNELYNNLDAKDKIINEQALEIANLNKRLENEQKVVEEYLRLEDDYELLYNDLDNANSKLSDYASRCLKAREIIETYITLNPMRIRNKIDILVGKEELEDLIKVILGDKE